MSQTMDNSTIASSEHQLRGRKPSASRMERMSQLIDKPMPRFCKYCKDLNGNPLPLKGHKGKCPNRPNSSPAIPKPKLSRKAAKMGSSRIGKLHQNTSVSSSPDAPLVSETLPPASSFSAINSLQYPFNPESALRPSNLPPNTLTGTNRSPLVITIPPSPFSVPHSNPVPYASQTAPLVPDISNDTTVPYPPLSNPSSKTEAPAQEGSNPPERTTMLDSDGSTIVVGSDSSSSAFILDRNNLYTSPTFPTFSGLHHLPPFDTASPVDEVPFDDFRYTGAASSGHFNDLSTDTPSAKRLRLSIEPRESVRPNTPRIQPPKIRKRNTANSIKQPPPSKNYLSCSEGIVSKAQELYDNYGAYAVVLLAKPETILAGETKHYISPNLLSNPNTVKKITSYLDNVTTVISDLRKAEVDNITQRLKDAEGRALEKEAENRLLREEKKAATDELEALKTKLALLEKNSSTDAQSLASAPLIIPEIAAPGDGGASGGASNDVGANAA